MDGRDASHIKKISYEISFIKLHIHHTLCPSLSILSNILCKSLKRQIANVLQITRGDRQRKVPVHKNDIYIIYIFNNI
jgi:hypothetical protein